LTRLIGKLSPNGNGLLLGHIVGAGATFVAQRIKAEVATRPGDYLNGSDIRLAEGWMGTALQAVPDETAQVGCGGELIPVSEEGGALVLRNTVEHPHYVTADAGRDRLDLASKAGVLEMALDVVETIEAQNSLEKMLAHQLAAAHHASMAMTAQLNRCIEKHGATMTPMLGSAPPPGKSTNYAASVVRRDERLTIQ
jgi:hypothetical protein